MNGSGRRSGRGAPGRLDDLRARLAAHEPWDADERDHLRRTTDLVDSVREPFARDTWVPGHVTSSGYVLSPSGDALLLIRHAVLERWLQPGGHVEPSDRGVVEAARREVREETGLRRLVRRCAPDAVFDVDVHAIPARPGQPAHEHFDVRFLFQAAEARVLAGSDAREVRWVPVDELAAGLSGGCMARILHKIVAVRGS